jgi:hypothetical protein
MWVKIISILMNKEMESIYVFICDGADWEDMVVYLSPEEAIEASIKKPFGRVEMFYKSEKGGFVPSYNYYKNGNYVETK